MHTFKERKFPLFTKFTTTPAIPAIIWLITGFLFVVPQQTITHYFLLLLTALCLSIVTFFCCVRCHHKFLILLPVGMLLMFLARHPPMQTYLKHLPREECHATITGVITEIKQAQNSQRITVQLKTITCYEETQKVSGKILIPIPNFSPPPQKLSPGMTFSADGAFLLPTIYPQFNEKNYLSSKRIFRKFSITQWNYIHQPKTIFQHLLFQWDAYKTSLNLRLINGLENNKYHAMLSAMILGIRDDLPQDVVQEFVLSGTIHLLAVSGLHAAAIAWIIISILKLLRTNYLKQWYLLIAILGGYVFLTGLSPSASRTWLMIFLFSLGKIKCRYVSPLQSIAAAAFIQLMINPCLIFNSGFQYSYLIVASLIISLPQITTFYNMITANHFWLPIHLTAGSKISRTVFSCFLGSTIAWGASAGLTLLYNQIFIPFSIFLNVIVIHFATFLLSAGIIKIIVADIPWLYTFINLFLNTLLNIIQILNNLYNSIPGAVIHVAQFPLWAVLIYITLFSCFLLSKHKLKSLILLCLLICFSTMYPQYKNSGQHHLMYCSGGNLYSPIFVLKHHQYPPIIITEPVLRNMKQVSEYLNQNRQIPQKIYYLQQIRTKLPNKDINLTALLETTNVVHIHCIKNGKEITWHLPDLNLTVHKSRLGQWEYTYQGKTYSIINGNEYSWQTTNLRENYK